MQTQLLQGLAHNAMNPPQPQHAPPQSRLGEFMRTRPPTFSHCVDPLEAEGEGLDFRLAQEGASGGEGLDFPWR